MVQEREAVSIFKVSIMHEKFGFTPLLKPGFLPVELMKMRLNFMLEELTEIADACGFEMRAQYNTMKDELNCGFQPKKHFKRSPEDLGLAFDGLLDLEVVLHGTAHLMGFMSHVPPDVSSRYATVWSEGQDRVFNANMAKERCKPGEVGKRGSSFDLIKPKGWKAPEFGDLLK